MWLHRRGTEGRERTRALLGRKRNKFLLLEGRSYSLKFTGRERHGKKSHAKEVEAPGPRGTVGIRQENSKKKT